LRRSGDRNLRICAILRLRDVLHRVIDLSEGISLAEEILDVMICAHNQRELGVVVIQPLAIPFLEDDAHCFVEHSIRHQLPWESESTFLGTVLETSRYVLVIMELSGSDDVESLYFYRLFERFVVRRQHGLESPVSRLRKAFIDGLGRHALAADVLDVIKQPLWINWITLGFVSNRLRRSPTFDPQLNG
jgi:hypothetical protein